MYQVGVNYPANSITTLTFNTTSLQTISYVSASYSFNGATTPIVKLSNTTTQFIFNTSSIPSGSIVTFVFKGLTPSKTGIYPVVDIVTNSSGN